MYSVNDLQEIHSLFETALNNFTNDTVPPEDIGLFQTISKIANVDVYLAAILRDNLCMSTDTGDPDFPPLSTAECKQAFIRWLKQNIRMLEYHIERKAYDEKHLIEYNRAIKRRL